MPPPEPLRQQFPLLLAYHQEAARKRLYLLAWRVGTAGVALGLTACFLTIAVGCLLMLIWTAAGYYNSPLLDALQWVFGVVFGPAATAVVWTVWYRFSGTPGHPPLEELLARLERDHAAEVAALGGVAVLRDPVQVRAILDAPA